MPGTIEWPEDDGLVLACQLDGRGSAARLTWRELDAEQLPGGVWWAHLDRKAARVERWLRDKSGLTDTTIDALLAEETRPRVFRGKVGTIAILRGVNTNPGAVAENMVSIRIWSDGKRVITLRHRRLQTPRDVLAQLVLERCGPRDASELFEGLITRLTERKAAIINGFDDELDNIEEHVEEGDATEVRRELSDLRQEAVVLRRYIAPQREALTSLLIDPPEWLAERSRARLRDTADRLMRYIEELDAARERSMVLKDDISNRLAESTNKTLYILSIISAVFL
ncbi:MAG TPA: CorA family divalent cation transporter, partial [Steroidobacteraceae bacterium]|nr:CorA family divalent cation transporter [Steroidobacteraceae bacterium]